MAASDVIGALRVNLGLDSAQFSAGLKKTQAGLASFGKVAVTGFAAAATAAAAAGAAFAVAGKKAIDTADAMSKTAQKVGVATEALSRLNYAAGYSDVSLEQLSGGLQKLTRNLADVASGSKGPAATALQALGISATDAAGNLRNSDAVFADIADRFARLEDGSTKTALAMQLFGRTGAELIPLLNSGRDGLRAMADESDRLGLTISTKTGRAAEAFNDTLTKVGRILEGVSMKVAEAALPALQQLADMLASPAFASAAQGFGQAIVSGLSVAIQVVTGLTNAARDLFSYIAARAGEGFATVDEASIKTLEGRISESKRILNDPGNAGQDMTNLRKTLAQEESELARRKFMDPAGKGASFGQLSAFGMGSGKVGGLDIEVPTFGSMGGSDAMDRRLEALRQSLMTEEQLEIDSHAKRLAEIAAFYENDAIKKDERDQLIEGAQRQHGETMAALAQEQADKEAAIRDSAISGVANIFGSLSKLAEQFGEKNLAAAKAFGIAEAVVNTAQGITKALTLPPPASWIQAGAVAAAGAAQIATIASTSKGSTTKPTAGGEGAAASASQQSSSRSISFNLQGDYFSASSFGSMVQRLNDELGVDGLELVVNHKQA